MRLDVRPFWVLFFSLSVPWPPKRAPDESRWALVGSKGRPWRLKRSFLEGSEIGIETELKKEPKRRALGRSKTSTSSVRSLKIKVLGRAEQDEKRSQK